MATRSYWDITNPSPIARKLWRQVEAANKIEVIIAAGGIVHHGAISVGQVQLATGGVRYELVPGTRYPGWAGADDAPWPMAWRFVIAVGWRAALQAIRHVEAQQMKEAA